MDALLLVCAILGAILIWGLLLWLLVRALFAHLSGWPQLARRYPSPGRPLRWDYRGQTVRVGRVRYRRCVKVAAQPDGLYLAATSPLHHPTLRIPWNNLSQPAPCTVYGRPYVRLTLGSPPVGTLEFPAALYQSFATKIPSASTPTRR